MRSFQLAWLVYLVLPTVAFLLVPDQLSSHVPVDYGMAVWRMWSVSQGEGYISHVVAYPHGQNLMASAGGWTDNVVGGWLAAVVGPMRAYEGVSAAFLVLAGLGGHRLAKEMGATERGALFAGLILQLDGAFLSNIGGGRIEHGAVGAFALAVALAIHCWRTDGIIACGAAGALVIWSGWELAVMLAVSMVFVGAALVAESRDRAAVGRWVAAAAVTTVLSAPLVWIYVTSTAGLPEAHGFGRWLASGQTVGIVGWLIPGVPRAGWVVLAACVAVPWTVPPAHRRLALAIGALLAAFWLLSLGPNPALFAPPFAPVERMDPSTADAPPGASWAPFTWLQAVMPRFHWPARWLEPIGIFGAVAGAWAVDGLERRKPRAGVALGVVLVGALVVENGLVGWLPRGRTLLPPRKGLLALAAAPPGAVIDLPIRVNPPEHLDDQLHQLTHGKPILFDVQLRHLGDGWLDARVRRDPVLSWFSALTSEGLPQPRRFGRADFAGLQADGYRYVTLRRGRFEPDRWQMALDSLAQIGPTLGRDGDSWYAWDLDRDEGARP